MNKCLIGHHSVADWDKTVNAQWALSATVFVSAPTSLRIGNTPGVQEDTPFLCRTVPTRNLPQGQLETYHYSTPDANNMRLYFRNQAALGVSDDLNSYNMIIFEDRISLYRVVADVHTHIASHFMNTNPNTWYRDRVTWWNGLDPHCDPALAVMFERYLAGVWEQQGEWMYDTANQFKDSAINRCGPGSYQTTGIYNYIDDTKIFEPS